ncbi:hypothetical protein SynA1840_50014 [Synechococcus sp. A18-40]|nr:hypothetical protein SynA1840_50014 [Synechococcus sp. A18-40]
MLNLNLATKKWIFNTWDVYEPEYFVSVLWSDMPTCPVKCSSHASILRNKILCKTTGASKCSRIPDLPHRLGMTTFCERTFTQKGKVTYHTHLHIFNTNNRWRTPVDLDLFIRYQAGLRIEKLLKSDTEFNEGVVVKKWVRDHHRYYNLKEQERQKRITHTRYTQDKDLLLDPENSDLLPMELRSNGHKRVFAGSY